MLTLHGSKPSVNIQMCKYPSLFEFFLGYSIKVGFCGVNFHFFDSNFSFKYKACTFRDIRHAHNRLCKWAKVFIWKKVFLRGRVTLPAKARQLDLPNVFSLPETGSGSFFERLIEFCKEISEKLLRVTETMSMGPVISLLIALCPLLPRSFRKGSGSYSFKILVDSLCRSCSLCYYRGCSCWES